MEGAARAPVMSVAAAGYGASRASDGVTMADDVPRDPLKDQAQRHALRMSLAGQIRRPVRQEGP